MNHGSTIDKQIREATERGEFDDLAGKGKPLPGAGTHLDENWWLHNYLRREGVSADAMLPPSLVLRKESERIQDTVRDMPTEREVRATVAELNRRIADWLRIPHGPYVPIGPLDTEAVVAQWRADRAATRQTPTRTRSAPTESVGWWRRLLRR
ncbi:MULTISPECIES: DUF1992 domain-containing protein [unclassified Nocardia]|uniref:DnaJ family domain-containing protein n=1 Tax=unclassified Nocardia TaxID=2637762 RepID=UPI0027DFABBD|nr:MULTISPECIES: DUF1992 domain-containing protein [unclassified Nocardia]